MKLKQVYNSEIRNCAFKYAAIVGLPYHQAQTYRPVQENVSKCIADLFDAMPHAPMNPLVRASYEQFVQEIIDQYHFAVETMGLCVEPYLSPGQPYESSREMIDDIRLHKHLYYFKTECGYGQNSGNRDLDNPMLTPTDVHINGHQLLVNDIFRVVHDLFGHAKEGYKFSPRGEENAWLEHLQLFTPLARPALTTETRGQSNWFNFGPHLRDESGALIKRGEIGWVLPSERPYSKQKTGLLPAYVSGVQLLADSNSGQIQVHQIEDWDAACI
jgi:hypothetical protein